MTTPLPFTWPYCLIFWPIYLWVFIPEFRIVRKATHRAPVPVEDRGSLRILLAGGGVSFLAAVLIPFVVDQATLPGNPTVLFFIGVLHLLTGRLLRPHRLPGPRADST